MLLAILGEDFKKPLILFHFEKEIELHGQIWWIFLNWENYFESCDKEKLDDLYFVTEKSKFTVCSSNEFAASFTKCSRSDLNKSHLNT